jgi:superfamily I DNA/RNA helicase
MNEGHLPVSNTSPTDDEVRQFIVALTRARKSCTLVSAGRLGEQQLNDSCFVNWIGPVLERYSLSKSGLRRLDPLSS